MKRLDVVLGGRSASSRPTFRTGIGAVYALLAATIVVLGLNWPIMSIGLRSSSPLWFTVLRFGAAAVVVLAVASATGRLRPPPRSDLPVVLSVGLVRIAMVAAFVFLALQFVPPGRSSVLVWTASLWAVPMAALALDERMSPLRWAGLITGISGIVLLFEPWGFIWSDRDVLIGHALLVLAAVMNAAVAVHIRGHRWQSNPLDLLPWQLAAGTCALVIAAVAAEGMPAIEWSWGFTANVAYQAVLASAFATWAQQTVLRRHRATSTTLAMMAIPVVGLVSSFLILDETVTVAGLIGVVAILSGVAVNVTADARSTAVIVP